MEYDVFFSYPHKDAREVNLILESLRARGLNVWIDHSKIKDMGVSTKNLWC